MSQSKRILLQVGTIFRPTNWKEEAATYDNHGKKTNGFKILNTGTMPWMGMPAEGSISIKNKLIKKATQLDAAGYAVKELRLNFANGALTLQLPKDAYYILLEE